MALAGDLILLGSCFIKSFRCNAAVPRMIPCQDHMMDTHLGRIKN